MIHSCTTQDFDQIHEIINDGARAYRGNIPADRLRDPYMSREEFQREIEAGVTFWGHETDGQFTGVMGTQDVDDPLKTHPVNLIRHAYVRTNAQGQGIGAQLLVHLRAMTNRPVLIGTWADATWAIHFYQKHGFEIVPIAEKEQLLRRFWTVPDRQIETSVVLADTTWRTLNPQ
jgi:GNAT superfamily N-acetyltransferase